MEASQVKIIRCNNNETDTNSYVLKNDISAIVIDPNNFDEVVTAIGESTLEYIFLTHEHFDHIKAVDKLREKFSTQVIAQRFTSENIQSASKNLSRYSNFLLDFMNKPSTSPVEEITIAPADIVFDKGYKVVCQGYTFNFQHTPGHSLGSSCIHVNDYLFVGDSLFEDCEPMLKGPGTSKKDYKNITLPFFHSLPLSTQVFSGHYNSFMLEDKLKDLDGK